MDALPAEPIELVACDPPRGIRRRYRIAVCRDLFGHVVVETGWGRIGAQGRSIVRSFAVEAEALRYVRAVLARRGTAPARIGIAYVATEPAAGMAAQDRSRSGIAE